MLELEKLSFSHNQKNLKNWLLTALADYYACDFDLKIRIREVYVRPKTMYVSISINKGDHFRYLFFGYREFINLIKYLNSICDIKKCLVVECSIKEFIYLGKMWANYDRRFSIFMDPIDSYSSCKMKKN